MGNPLLWVLSPQSHQNFVFTMHEIYSSIQLESFLLQDKYIFFQKLEELSFKTLTMFFFQKMKIILLANFSIFFFFWQPRKFFQQLIKKLRNPLYGNLESFLWNVWQFFSLVILNAFICKTRNAPLWKLLSGSPGLSS